MTIQTGDIKLLASQTMDDTPEGGGAMTGNVVVDGLSNNLFPDTSTLDRAFGRVNIRQVYGVAHTDDSDSLLGSHMVVTDAPDDPLVHCTLMAAPRWGATRDDYRETIERYLVKGAQLLCKVLDQHYAGSLLLRLYQVNGAAFPAPGEAIVLRNPDGQEQYVRVLKVTVTQARLTELLGGGTSAEFTANIATCELAQELVFDVVGAAATQLSATLTTLARVYSTTPSAGAKFYAVKPLAAAATTGDATVTLAGGIFTPIVPAATSETPLIDQVPHGPRPSLANTGLATLTLPAVVVDVQAGLTLRTPGPFEPGSLSFSAGATPFTDNGAGLLKQGALTVGALDYRAGIALFVAGSPDYGVQSVALTFKPATSANSPSHSDSMAVTLANQGRSFVYQFAPASARGSFIVSYMAQGRWYDIYDNGNGQLVGSDPSYGSGTISYATSSVAYTLGANPDIGSDIIYTWGDAASAVPLAPAGLPTKAFMLLDLGQYAYSSNYAFTWSRGVTNYAATFTFTTGVWTGDATGGLPYYAQSASKWFVRFEPNTLPEGNVAVASTAVQTVQTGFTSGGGGNYTLTNTPVQPRSVSGTVLATPATGVVLAEGGTLKIYDNGAGVLLESATKSVVGSVNYTTGAVLINTTYSTPAQILAVQSFVAATGSVLVFDKLTSQALATVSISSTSGLDFRYTTAASGIAVNSSFAPVLRVDVPTPAPQALNVDSPLFTLAGETYYAVAGVLRKGWDALAGDAPSAVAGSVTSLGAITITAPVANGTNAVGWRNAALVATSGYIARGVFRLASAPIKVGVFQLSGGTSISQADNAGVLSGGGVTGTVDFTRGIVRWSRGYNPASGLTGWFTSALPSGAIGGVVGAAAAPLQISLASVPGYVAPDAPNGYLYNAVFLQYLPLNSTLLGLDTSRLPLDGRVPAYRPGDLVVVHNTLATQLVNPLVKGTVYPLGRNRVAYVRVRTATGVTVSSALYSRDLDNGSITVLPASDITGLPQPWTVEHRIEDTVVVNEADISGKLKFTRGLTHDYPAGTSHASSALVAGDVFGRVSNVFDQSTWTGAWSDALIDSDTAAAFNTIDYPLSTTNRGAVTERWALIFTSNTAFRVVGENYGQIATGNINTVCAPINTATGVPFFTIPVLGWGTGWSAGNVLRLNTYACGACMGVVRTVLQGPDTLASDQFTLSWRGDVNA